MEYREERKTLRDSSVPLPPGAFAARWCKGLGVGTTLAPVRQPWMPEYLGVGVANRVLVKVSLITTREGGAGE
jgi:hypothetical protein